jgi:hypothetical protein
MRPSYTGPGVRRYDSLDVSTRKLTSGPPVRALAGFYPGGDLARFPWATIGRHWRRRYWKSGMSNPYTIALFSYGTLQLEAVQRETFGRLLEGRADAMPGFKKEMLEITDPRNRQVEWRAVSSSRECIGRSG